MAYYLLVRYYSNKGYILDNPHYFSSGVTSYSSVTASSSSSYKYFKTDSTRTNQTSTVIKGATTSSGTYGNVGNRYTASSASTVCNLTDVSTFGLTRDGYHINADEAYKSSDGSKVYGQNGSSAPSANRATISRLGGSTSANKTVSIYVNWIGNSYSVKFNASGGSGTMSDQTGFVFGTGKALSLNTFTRTGYTFAGWSKSSGGATQVFYVSDVGPYDPVSIGTDGTYLYFKQNSTKYYRVTVDNSNSYTDVGSTAPSGVSTWIGEVTHFTFQGNEYYWYHTYNDNSDIDRCYIYRVDGAQTVDYTNGASMSDAAGTIPAADGTTVVNLYAVWTPNTYSVLLNDNQADGTGTGLTIKTMTYGATTNNSVTVPTRTGYTFYGYYTAKTGGTQVYNSSGTRVTGTYWTSGGSWQYTGNVPLYAQWAAKTYSYKLDPNGGTYNGTTGVTTKSTIYGTTINNTPGVPTRTGWIFTGWYTSDNRMVFDANGNPVNDYLNGPWVNCSPTSPFYSGGTVYYIHYGELIWAYYYSSSSNNGLGVWDGEAWATKGTYTTNGGLYGAGNLVGAFTPTLPQNPGWGLTAILAKNCDLWNGSSNTYINTALISGTDFAFAQCFNASSSTTLPTDGYIWIASYSTVPTYYAHWTETTPPSNLSITSTNNVASSQTVTLSATDNVGITGYYWGTSSSSSVTYTDVTSTTNWSTTVTVSSGGLYYLRVKDAAGNTVYTSKRFYKTFLTTYKNTVNPTSIITMSGNSFVLPTPVPNTGYVNNGYWVIHSGTGFTYGTTFTPNLNYSSNIYLFTGAALTDVGKLPAANIVITDEESNFSITTNSNGIATISKVSVDSGWEDWGEVIPIIINQSEVSPSGHMETLMYQDINTGCYNTANELYGVKVTIVDGNYQFYVYDLSSSAPKVYIKVNGTWKSAFAYVKVNGVWTLIPTIYVKQNGSWTQT